MLCNVMPVILAIMKHDGCRYSGTRQGICNPLRWEVRMGAIASQITSLAIVYSTVNSVADQRKHQSSASLAFVWGNHRDRWIPRTKGQLRGKCFHLMTSLCTMLTAGDWHLFSLFQWRSCVMALTGTTYWVLVMPHICVTELSHHRFR